MLLSPAPPNRLKKHYLGPNTFNVGRLPLRSTRQSSDPQEKLPASTAQVNLGEEMKDTDKSSDESEDDEAAVNIPQKGGDISHYDQCLPSCRAFALLPIGTKMACLINLLIYSMCKKNAIRRMGKIILIGSTSKLS